MGSSGRILDGIGPKKDWSKVDDATACAHLWSLATSLRSGFPTEHPGLGYWNSKIPVAQGWVNDPRYRTERTKACLCGLGNALDALYFSREKTGFSASLFALVCVPDLFRSELLVFFDPDLVDPFFERIGPEMYWTPLGKGRSLLLENGLENLFSFEEAGLSERIMDPEIGLPEVGELWVYGDIPASIQ